MILYHLDRLGKLTDGQDINLIPISEMETDIGNSEFLRSFSDGVSNHALTYLTNTSKYLFSLPFAFQSVETPIDFISAASLSMNKNFVDAQINEVTLELVRRSNFPNLPSRFRSIFAVDSIDEFKNWKELTYENGTPVKHNVFSFDVHGGLYRFDSNWLKGGISFGFDRSAGKYFFGFMPAASYDYAFNYWSGLPSPCPRWEYLVELPVHGIHLTAAI